MTMSGGGSAWVRPSRRAADERSGFGTLARRRACVGDSRVRRRRSRPRPGSKRLLELLELLEPLESERRDRGACIR